MPGPTFIVGSLTYIADLNTLSNAILTPRTQGVNYTAVRGFWDILTASGLQVTLPLSPAAGDLIRFSAKSSAVTSVTFLRNGQPIDGVAADLTISGTDKDMNVWMLYIDVSTGWRPILSAAGGWLAWGGVQTTTFTAAKNTGYAIDASTFTGNLPASPAVGNQVRFTATTHARTGFTIGRNGQSIHGAAADVVVNAQGWDILATFVGGAVGWLLVFSTIVNPAPRYDSTLHELRFHNTQRELSAPAGWQPYALAVGATATDSYGNNTALPISGGSIAVAIPVTGHMLLQAVAIYNGDTATLRALEWRLYKQRLNNGNAGENTLDEVPGANGTDSFTPSAASVRVCAASGAPVYLSPGIYWLVVRNTDPTSAWDLRYSAAPAVGLLQTICQTKTLGSALGATLDFVAATWTKSSTINPAVALYGRVFGQTTAF